MNLKTHHRDTEAQRKAKHQRVERPPPVTHRVSDPVPARSRLSSAISVSLWFNRFFKVQFSAVADASRFGAGSDP